ncbi:MULTISPECIES: sulfatase [unclassified Imperialibacter]|uniref:sulfatase family protein n=1 Tax=unclassified Imperialibacter TaxID=2629706 RepID=UPI001256C79B|nr:MULTISPECIES: sulfatase [unclassified Imperialibacter]CAD5264189.1 N-acetylglucosamine-6-O-sulfatase [Imperialibacter sp. 89]CAD5280268.1 N-acetylglucosamine-6-O-sulfatase [Imperialibacter sp. 75]VVT31711.1 Sulfatase [Imperialibacter sp. EC-SDR9]
MKLISQLTFGLLFVAFLYSCSPSAPKEAEKKRPNIVFIMSDDHAYQAISAYSNKLIETPNIDRIAKQGMLFTNASVTNSICAPSRAVILTGKHSHLNGKIDNNFPFDTTNVTFPQLLQQEGYQTAMFGKLHFGNSPKGFDQFKILPGQGAYYNPDFITKNEGNIKVEGYVTDIITDMTLNWLDKERDAEKPFLLMYLHKAPHREWLPAERHYTEYIKKTFEEPATLFDNYEGRGSAAKEAEMNLLTHMNWAGDSKIYPEVMDELGIPETANWDKAAFKREVGRMNPEQRAKWDAVYGPMNEEFKKNYPNMTQEEKMKWRYQRYMQDYLGSIASVDEGVGKVLDYLEQNGLAENTIIVYTSDQGFYLGEHGWFDKRFIYNESFKTPLLVKWPGVVQPGTTNTQMVQNLDFAPTLLSAVGAEVPADMQGESLIPLLKGENDSFKRDAVYYHYYEYPGVHMVKRHYAIVTEEYKLVHFYHDVDEWELYDRKKDLQEMTNVYDDPAYADVVKDLKEKLAGLRVKYKDSEELDQMYIEKYEELK